MCYGSYTLNKHLKQPMVKRYLVSITIGRVKYYAKRDGSKPLPWVSWTPEADKAGKWGIQQAQNIQSHYSDQSPNLEQVYVQPQ